MHWKWRDTEGLRRSRKRLYVATLPLARARTISTRPHRHRRRRSPHMRTASTSTAASAVAAGLGESLKEFARHVVGAAEVEEPAGRMRQAERAGRNGRRHAAHRVLGPAGKARRHVAERWCCRECSARPAAAPPAVGIRSSRASTPAGRAGRR